MKRPRTRSPRSPSARLIGKVIVILPRLRIVNPDMRREWGYIRPVGYPLGSKGLFKVSGFQVDTEKMQCECPDYKARKETCKHLFAAILFVKNRGRKVVEDLPGYTWVDEIRDMPVETLAEKLPIASKPLHDEMVSKHFDRQSTITRLAVLNTATEILKTHRKPIEFNDIVSLAAQLEQWALGK